MEKDNLYDFYSFFRNLEADNLTQIEINMFVEKSIKIAVNYVMLNYLRIQKVLSMNKLNPQDLAIDSIAPLFETRESERFFLLRESFKLWNPKVKNKYEALFMLSKLIERKVIQQIGVLLKDTDPFFDKILDSVKYLLKKSGYTKLQILGTNYIVENKDCRINLPIIDPLSFDRLPAHLFRDSHLLLPNLMDYIKKETGFFPALPVNKLVQRLKRLHLNELKIKTTTRDNSQELEIEQIIDKAYNNAVEKLNSTYMSKKKLNKREARSFREALRDISIDLQNGYSGYGLFSYLKPHFPGLGPKRYKARYQGMLEYLTKVMKSTIGEQIVPNN